MTKNNISKSAFNSLNKYHEYVFHSRVDYRPLNESPYIHMYLLFFQPIGFIWTTVNKNRMHCIHNNDDDDYSSPDCGLQDLINLNGYTYYTIYMIRLLFIICYRRPVVVIITTWLLSRVRSSRTQLPHIYIHYLYTPPSSQVRLYIIYLIRTYDVCNMIRQNIVIAFNNISVAAAVQSLDSGSIILVRHCCIGNII